MGHLDGHAGEDKLVDILEEDNQQVDNHLEMDNQQMDNHLEEDNRQVDNHLEEDNRQVDIRLEGDIQLVGRLVGDSLLGVDIHVLV